MIKVSVIVPIYKVEKYINNCVDSIINQTYSNLEIILVDDGSPDKCPQICDEYKKKDNRVKVFHQVNGGVSSARNNGIKNASGDYIVFIDSDDYYNPNSVETMVRHIEDDTDLIVGGIKVIKSKDKTKKIIPLNKKYTEEEIEKYIAKSYYDDFFTSVTNKMYKASILKTCKFNNELNFGEDFDFNFQFIKNVKSVKTISNLIYNYITYKNQESLSKIKDYEAQIICYQEQYNILIDYLREKKSTLKVINKIMQAIFFIQRNLIQNDRYSKKDKFCFLNKLKQNDFCLNVFKASKINSLRMFIVKSILRLPVKLKYSILRVI